jgi:putative transposase
MCGIPDVLYVDHGSDFTSDQLVQVAADLHFERVHSTVARPQGRGKIERFFGTVNTELRLLIVRNYNHRPHSETGKTPFDAWISDGWMPRLPESLELLDGLLLTVAKTREVCRDDIHFQGLRYVALPLGLERNLAGNQPFPVGDDLSTPCWFGFHNSANV